MRRQKSIGKYRKSRKSTKSWKVWFKQMGPKRWVEIDGFKWTGQNRQIQIDRP